MKKKDKNRENDISFLQHAACVAFLYRVSRDIINNNPSFIIKNFIWLSLYCERLHILSNQIFFFL